jgi:AcrR family transcriptional regulator
MVNADPSAAPKRSFTELARRQQIVGAAIETIAELGYTKSSYAKIAERAGLSSTGMISYHFRDRQDLIAEIISVVYSEMGAELQALLAAQSTPAAMLAAYISGSIDFMKKHGAAMGATLEIFMNGGAPELESDHDVSLDTLSGILRAGQKSGDFGSFDPEVMALAIQRSIEGVQMMTKSAPAKSFDFIAKELVATFDRATRRN